MKPEQMRDSGWRPRSRLAPMWTWLRNNLNMASLAGAWFTLSVLYVENRRFHDFVFNLFSRFPHFMQEFVVGLLIPILIVVGKRRKAKEDDDVPVQRRGNSQDQGI